MEVDEAVVDLSISASNRASTPPSYHQSVVLNSPYHPQLAQAATSGRRILRPRTEPRSYADTPDALINGCRSNGIEDYSGESSDGEMLPPLPTIKELTPQEVKQRERGLRRLREELRAEEMKLVLLKKLKQSQQLKENVAVLPPSIPASALPPTGLPSGLSITPTTVKVPSANKVPPMVPQVAHSRHSIGSNSNSLKIGVVPGSGGNSVANLMRVQQPPPPRSNAMHGPPLSASPLNRTSLSVPQPPQRSSMGRPPSNFPPGVKDLSPSVTITPAPPQSVKERPREDNQTPAQRQAAAKLALRKQLEKTLLQIPPPKPPPPEMHFIPNPSNTEFIYLVGLEHVVDFLTKETKIPLPPQPFSCSQCQSDFTPVWKWEISKKRGVKSVICEQCVTNNVKKALKAEHTNRLKTAFVKALQQEQEIEQRLAQNGVFTSSSPAPSPVTPEALPKSVTPTPAPRHAATPPAPPQPQPTPPPPLPRTVHSSSSVVQQQQQDKYAAQQQQQQQQHQQHQQHQQQEKYVQQQQQQNAAAMQALHQQLLRSLSAGGPPAAAQMFQIPLFYPYQLAMAQAAASSKGSSANLAEIQRAADLQRQYLLDMIPPGPQQRHNWKT